MRFGAVTLRSGLVARSLSLRLGLVSGPQRGPALTLAPVQVPSQPASPRFYFSSNSRVSSAMKVLISLN